MVIKYFPLVILVLPISVIVLAVLHYLIFSQLVMNVFLSKYLSKSIYLTFFTFSLKSLTISSFVNLLISIHLIDY